MSKIMKFFLFFMLMNVCVNKGITGEPKKTAIITCAEDCGMFRTMASVVGFLHLYEIGRYEGVAVDFETKGLYYDPEYGENWWSYYFEPLSIGQIIPESCVKTVNGPADTDCAMLTEFGLYKREVNVLLSKYVKLKPHIQAKVQEFTSRHFNGFPVIGIHYRGTDKSIEAPRSEFEHIVEYVQGITQALISMDSDLMADQVQIFIATDEDAFLEFMKIQYGARVIYLEQVIRSDSMHPVHKLAGNGYKKGEDALLDCLLLSQCNWLIKTSSNLSLFSTYFNPDMPVCHVTGRHWRLPME